MLDAARAKSAGIRRLAAEGLTREAIAAQLNIGVASVYRILRVISPCKWRGARRYRDCPVAFPPALRYPPLRFACSLNHLSTSGGIGSAASSRGLARFRMISPWRTSRSSS
jgi:hypothetical protein